MVSLRFSHVRQEARFPFECSRLGCVERAPLCRVRGDLRPRPLALAHVSPAPPETLDSKATSSGKSFCGDGPIDQARAQTARCQHDGAVTRVTSLWHGYAQSADDLLAQSHAPCNFGQQAPQIFSAYHKVLLADFAEQIRQRKHKSPSTARPSGLRHTFLVERM